MKILSTIVMSLGACCAYGQQSNLIEKDTTSVTNDTTKKIVSPLLVKPSAASPVKVNIGQSGSSNLSSQYQYDKNGNVSGGNTTLKLKKKKD